MKVEVLNLGRDQPSPQAESDLSRIREVLNEHFGDSSGSYVVHVVWYLPAGRWALLGANLTTYNTPPRTTDATGIVSAALEGHVSFGRIEWKQ